MSIEQIAELVNQAESGQPPAPKPETPPSAESPPVVETPPAAAAPAAAAPAASTPPAEPDGPVSLPSGQTIPYGVLRNTRADRDRWQAEAQRATAALNELQERHRADTERLTQQLQAQGSPATTGQVQQAQQIANRAGLRDQNGNPVDVATVDFTQFEGQYPPEILTALGALQAQVIDLRESDAQRRAREQHDTRTQEQIDIDSVPRIAQWHSDPDPTMWNAVNAAYSSLVKQDAWKDKSRVEVLTEVANRLGGAQPPATTTPPPTPAVTPGTKPLATHIAAARAQSVPLSHSDLPAGSPPAQGEAEQLNSLDITQLAERFANASPAEQEAMLRRYG